MLGDSVDVAHEPPTTGKTYFLVRNAIGMWPEWVSLFVADDQTDTRSGRRRAVPFCIGNDHRRWPMRNIALAILLDYLAGEEDCERKSVALSRAFAHKLSRIGSGGKLSRMNATSWSLSESDIERLVTEILVEAKQLDLEAFAVEEVCGQRRDVIRAAALVETVSRFN
ncbi:MAG: hypothetical protein C5B59_00530 [Bacteroidetes bacterium]|nr:MAG: hypothetical protein C5B59_00530 [Bacteroidota bacterium]